MREHAAQFRHSYPNCQQGEGGGGVQRKREERIFLLSSPLLSTWSRASGIQGLILSKEIYGTRHRCSAVLVLLCLPHNNTYNHYNCQNNHDLDIFPPHSSCKTFTWLLKCKRLEKSKNILITIRLQQGCIPNNLNKSSHPLLPPQWMVQLVPCLFIN